MNRFPIFFPLRTPVCVRPGTPLEVHFWRCCGATKVPCSSFSSCWSGIMIIYSFGFSSIYFINPKQYWNSKIYTLYITLSLP